MALLAVKDSHSAAARVSGVDRAYIVRTATVQPGEVHRLAATAASPQATPSQRRGAAAVLELLAAEHDELVTGSGDQPGHHRPLPIPRRTAPEASRAVATSTMLKVDGATLVARAGRR